MALARLQALRCNMLSLRFRAEGCRGFSIYGVGGCVFVAFVMEQRPSRTFEAVGKLPVPGGDLSQVSWKSNSGMEQFR